MYSLYKQDIIFIIILDRVPPSLNKLYYYYYHCLPTPTSRVYTGRRSLINSTRNMIYSLKVWFFYFLLYRRRYFLFVSELI